MSVAGVGAVALAAWLAGESRLAALVSGWRVMVPSTAFTFAWVGCGLAAIAAGSPRLAALGVAAAAAAAVFPGLSVIEYVTDARFGLERWLGVAFPPGSPVAGRMSPLTAVALSLIALALAGAAHPSTRTRPWVRLTAGTTLAVSWLAVLAVSFEARRLDDLPVFPGMAVLTIGLLAISSATLLAMVGPEMAGPRPTALLGPATLGLGFLAPLLFGQVRGTLAALVDPGLAAGAVVAAFAALLSAVVWSTVDRLVAFQRQRERLLEVLEQRVIDRTQALESTNRQLIDKERQLVDADRRKDEFLATLAHELRNPLAPIRTGLELLKSPEMTVDGTTQTHAILDRQLAHLVRLIDDLLDVGRITANKLDLRLERLSVADILHQAVETSRGEIDRGRHTLSVECPAPLTVIGDPTRLTQVVANLLQNACRYTAPGGRIRVSAALVDGVVEIRVADNGMGIAPRDLPRLFEKFAQLGPTLAPRGGLGLGLALVRGLVSLHGGSVAAFSDGPGTGSVFVVRLPAVEAAAGGEALPAAVARPPVPGPRRRVLVVDDNLDNADTLALYLRHRGHLVETAYDGDAAWQAAERFRPDVVLLDLGLPCRSGHDVCRAIRQQPWGLGMRIVAQTGWGQDADRQRSRDAGFDAHLVKPVDPALVADLIVAPR